MITERARKRDFEGIKKIFELSFTEEYARREVDIVRRIEKIAAVYPLVKTLSLFPNPYQNLFTVHVARVPLETGNGSAIAGMAQMSPRNARETRWHVDNIAVHPDFRGQGIARQLLDDVFAYYIARDAERFTLEVDTTNSGAIQLYEKLGFRRYSTLYYHKMSARTLGGFRDLSEIAVPPGLRLRTSNDDEALLSLYEQSIPQHIRSVEDRSVADFQRSLLDEGARWLKKSLKRSQSLHWVVEDPQRECLVASLEISAQLRQLPHVIQMTLNPGYSDMAEPLLQFALHQLAQTRINPVLIGSYECQRAKRDAVKALGFKKLTADFLMVKESLERIVIPTHNEEVQEGFSRA